MCYPVLLCARAAGASSGGGRGAEAARGGGAVHVAWSHQESDVTSFL